MADILILSTADWDHPLWTNKQHLAVSLADHGHRILYVDSLGIRPPRASTSRDFGRIIRRLRRAFRPPRRVRPSVWVVSPPVIPGGWFGLPLAFNRVVLRLSLLYARLHINFRTSLLWVFTPFAARYLNLDHYSQVVYQCVDRIQSQPGMPSSFIDLAEQDLCKLVDVVFTTAPRLQADLEPLNSRTYFFGNVADVQHFSAAMEKGHAPPADLPQVHGALILFIGAIDAYKLDLDMLKTLASTTPYWTYVLIGPVAETDPSTDVRTLQDLSNVHFLGTRDYQDLPNYLACADIALLPLQLNDYTEHMYPMKFFEYLASGTPVVGTAIPSLLDQRDVALLCDSNAESFRAAIECVLNGGGPDLELRLERARQNTYYKRTTEMLKHLRCL